MQEAEQIFREALRVAGLRLTRGRTAIFRALYRSQRPLSMQEIIARVGVAANFTSVYRSVASLARTGILRVVPRGFKSLYELSEQFRPHHHHATCERCGRSVELHDPQLEQLMQELAARAGLSPTQHHFEVFGVCQRCRNLTNI